MIELQYSLKRNGIISERARRQGRSLDRIERSIILAARERAIKQGVSRHSMNWQEMDGERDFKMVLAKIKVVAVFSYWDESGKILGDPPLASFIIRESNHPGLVIGGHVCAEQFINAGLKPPKSMPFKKWIRKGRPVVRK